MFFGTQGRLRKLKYFHKQKSGGGHWERVCPSQESPIGSSLQWYPKKKKSSPTKSSLYGKRNIGSGLVPRKLQCAPSPRGSWLNKMVKGWL